MTLPEMDSPSSHWSACLLLALYQWNDTPDGWMMLRAAQEQATGLARSRFGDPELALKTMSNIKRDLVQIELVEQAQRGRHYYLRLTERGERAASEIATNPDWGTADSPTAAAAARSEDVSLILGKRVGKDHKLGKALWGLMMRQLLAGQVDLLIIPRDQRTKARYWDEAGA